MVLELAERLESELNATYIGLTVAIGLTEQVTRGLTEKVTGYRVDRKCGYRFDSEGLAIGLTEKRWL